MIYNFFHLGMYRMMVLSGIIAFGLPIILQLLSKKLLDKIKLFIMLVYVLVILYFTVFSRRIGVERMINLMPFWSYTKLGQADIRWQVYMNVFLYIPFGFLLPYSSKRTFLQTFLIGLCLSLITETLQYIFALGLCETDDVIHNTLGTAMGYLYWCVLNKVSDRKRKFTK